MKTSGIVVRRALDDDADLARRGNGAGLRDRDFDPRRAEFANHDAADGRRERLDHLIVRCADELDQPFRELLIIQGAGNAVAGGGDLGVRADLEVDADDLLDAPFPFPEPDDRLDAKLAKKDLVHSSSFVLMAAARARRAASEAARRFAASACPPRAGTSPRTRSWRRCPCTAPASDSTRARRFETQGPRGSRAAPGWRPRRRPRRAA